MNEIVKYLHITHDNTQLARGVHTPTHSHSVKNLAVWRRIRWV